LDISAAGSIPCQTAATPAGSSSTASSRSRSSSTSRGKSLALLMSALQYSDVPGYPALLLRPTLSAATTNSVGKPSAFMGKGYDRRSRR
jgi:hypothetical protein